MRGEGWKETEDDLSGDCDCGVKIVLTGGRV